MDKILELIEEYLKALGIPERSVRIVVLPLTAVVISCLLYIGLGALEIANPWRTAFTIWVGAVLLCWVPLASRFLRQRDVAGWTLVTTTWSLTALLSFLWFLLGKPSLTLPFLVGAIHGGLVWLVYSFARRQLRRFALVSGLSILTLLIFVGVKAWEFQRPSPANKVSIWVAKYSNDSDGKARASFVEQLNATVRLNSALASSTEIRNLSREVVGETLDEQIRAARDLGRKQSAAIVVFGTVTDRGVATRIVQVEFEEGLKGTELLLFLPKLSSLPTEDVQVTVDLAKSVVGVTFLSNGLCASAERLFQNVLHDVLQDRSGAWESATADSLQAYLGASMLCGDHGGITRLTNAKSIYESLSTSKSQLIRAIGFNGVGVAESRLGTIEGSAADLKAAVASYQSAIDALPVDSDPPLRTVFQHNRGVALLGLSVYENPVQNIAESITSQKSALHALDRTEDPYLFSSTEGALCRAYTLLADQQEPVDNLKKAIAACEAGLARISPDTYPRKILCASLKTAAGEAYSQFALHNDVDTNSDKAVTLIGEALALVSRDKEPVLFADAHSALALALLFKTYQGGPEGASEALRKKRWTRAVLSMACALVIYDQLDRPSDARGAATLLRTVQSQSAPDLNTFVNYIAKETPPEGCSQEAVRIPALLAKWLK